MSRPLNKSPTRSLFSPSHSYTFYHMPSNSPLWDIVSTAGVVGKRLTRIVPSRHIVPCAIGIGGSRRTKCSTTHRSILITSTHLSNSCGKNRCQRDLSPYDTLKVIPKGTKGHRHFWTTDGESFIYLYGECHAWRPLWTSGKTIDTDTNCRLSQLAEAKRI